MRCRGVSSEFNLCRNVVFESAEGTRIDWSYYRTAFPCNEQWSAFWNFILGFSDELQVRIGPPGELNVNIREIAWPRRPFHRHFHSIWVQNGRNTYLKQIFGYISVIFRDLGSDWAEVVKHRLASQYSCLFIITHASISNFKLKLYFISE